MTDKEIAPGSPEYYWDANFYQWEALRRSSQYKQFYLEASKETDAEKVQALLLQMESKFGLSPLLCYYNNLPHYPDPEKPIPKDAIIFPDYLHASEAARHFLPGLVPVKRITAIHEGKLKSLSVDHEIFAVDFSYDKNVLIDEFRKWVESIPQKTLSASRAVLKVGMMQPAKGRIGKQINAKRARLSKHWQQYFEWYDHYISLKHIESHKGYTAVINHFNVGCHIDTMGTGIKEAKRLIDEAGKGRLLVPAVEWQPDKHDCRERYQEALKTLQTTSKPSSKKLPSLIKK